ncbi:NADH-quinone oxidoreductase subunit K [bacterium]|nr:NADH-quinone oxidoreductase subunit K [bacterium]
MTVYILDFIIFAIGIYSLIAKRHIIKKIIGMVLIEYSTNLFLILIGFRYGGIAPILSPDMNSVQFSQCAVDPLPQALVLTSIVIGLGTLALMAAYTMKLYEKYKTFDMCEIKRLRG